MQVRRASGDRGFTMIELLVTMVIMGVLMALATPAWQSYQGKQERISASRDVVSILRNAQTRATAEETVYRVDVDQTAKTLTLYRYDSAGTPVRRRALVLQGGKVRITGTSFTGGPAGSAATSVFFNPRGTASAGRLVVSREGDAKQHVITVEGLTGRVSTT